MPDIRSGSDFNSYRDTYRDEVQRSLALPGADAEFFIRAKARHLVELARQIGEPRHLDALDVGCGVGETDRHLEGVFDHLAGVDIACDLVERAAEANPWASYRHYKEGDPIPHEDRSFDLCFAICVLHHVSPADRAHFISEIARVTRPDGIVAIFEHNPWNPLTRRSVSNCEFDRDAVLLSRRETARLLTTGGIDPAWKSYIAFLPWDGRLLNRFERSMARVPAGAQYFVAGRRPEA